MSAMETENAPPPSICSRIRGWCPCSNLQLWAGYIIILLAIVLFAFLIYAQEKTLALILLFFVLGVTVSICVRLIYLSRRTAPYRQVPWNGAETGDTTEPLDPSIPLEQLTDVEAGGGMTPGQAISRDEMIVMQLQLQELQQARQARRVSRLTRLAAGAGNRRDRDRHRGLLRLGFAPLAAEAGSTHLQVSMLDRELGPNDYDMLLKLDEEVARAQAARIPRGAALPGGLSSSQINLFPSFIMPNVTTTDSGSKESGEFEPVKKPLPASLTEDCAVCLEPKQPGEVLRTVPCLHTFHVQCIDPWLQLKRTCPVCKMDFTQA